MQLDLTWNEAASNTEISGQRFPSPTDGHTGVMLKKVRNIPEKIKLKIKLQECKGTPYEGSKAKLLVFAEVRQPQSCLENAAKISFHFHGRTC